MCDWQHKVSNMKWINSWLSFKQTSTQNIRAFISNCVHLIPLHNIYFYSSAKYSLESPGHIIPLFLGFFGYAQQIDAAITIAEVVDDIWWMSCVVASWHRRRRLHSFPRHIHICSVRSSEFLTTVRFEVTQRFPFISISVRIDPFKWSTDFCTAIAIDKRHKKRDDYLWRRISTCFCLQYTHRLVQLLWRACDKVALEKCLGPLFCTVFACEIYIFSRILLNWFDLRARKSTNSTEDDLNLPEWWFNRHKSVVIRFCRCIGIALALKVCVAVSICVDLIGLIYRFCLQVLK